MMKMMIYIVTCLWLMSGCAANKEMEPNSGMQTASKTAPDFTQKEIRTEDGHIVKYEGGNGGGFVRSYKNGKKDGITAFYRNGVLYGEKSYKNGLLHGLSKNYYFPFALTETYYVDGKKHGVAKEWCDGNGRLKSREHYKYGKLDGLSEEWSCGKKRHLANSIEYSDGKKNGVYKMYDIINYNNGKLVSLTTYKNGIKNGISQEYDKGKLFSEVIYKNGRAFDMNGKYIPTIKVKE